MSAHDDRNSAVVAGPCVANEDLNRQSARSAVIVAIPTRTRVVIPISAESFLDVTREHVDAEVTPPGGAWAHPRKTTIGGKISGEASISVLSILLWVLTAFGREDGAE